MKMEKFSLFVAFIMIIKFGMTEAQEREIREQTLIRDRLLMLMCDQMTSYMTNGTMPEPVKIIPANYRTFVAGLGSPDPIQPELKLPVGRKMDKKSQKAGRTSPNDLMKPMRFKREVTTFQRDFEECSKAGANCVLDLEEA